MWRSVRGIGCAAEGPNHDFAAAESLTDVIVRLPFEMELHVRQRKGAEALTRAAAEPQTHRFGWSSVAPNARDLSRDPRAHGEVMVPDLVRAVERLAALDDLGIE